MIVSKYAHMNSTHIWQIAPAENFVLKGRVVKSNLSPNNTNDEWSNEMYSNNASGIGYTE